jgi:hypothetical protein
MSAEADMLKIGKPDAHTSGRSGSRGFFGGLCFNFFSFHVPLAPAALLHFVALSSHM